MNNREAIAKIKGMRFQVQSSLDEIEVDVDSKEAEQDNQEIVEAFDMAIKALSIEPQEHTDEKYDELMKQYKHLRKYASDLETKLSVEQTEWIPIKTRPLTKEEKEHYAEMGYSDDSVTFMYDCPLPDDGEEVLVTDWLGNVEFDTFIRDECDGCYFEENCDDGEVVAWMHKPSPYKGDTE